MGKGVSLFLGESYPATACSVQVFTFSDAELALLMALLRLPILPDVQDLLQQALASEPEKTVREALLQVASHGYAASSPNQTLVINRFVARVLVAVSSSMRKLVIRAIRGVEERQRTIYFYNALLIEYERSGAHSLTLTVVADVSTLEQRLLDFVGVADIPDPRNHRLLLAPDTVYELLVERQQEQSCLSALDFDKQEGLQAFRGAIARQPLIIRIEPHVRVATESGQITMALDAARMWVVGDLGAWQVLLRDDLGSRQVEFAPVSSADIQQSLACSVATLL